MSLTNTEARQAKPKQKIYKLSDAKGMYLEITPRGSKYWRLKYRFDGKEKRLALGVYPEISLAQAREARDKARQQLAQGIDPSAARKAEKESRKESAANSFEVIAREWLEKQTNRWSSDSYPTKVLRMLERDLFPRLGSQPIANIKASDLLVPLRKIESRGAIDTAHRAKQIAGQIFRYGVATGRCDRDPSGDLQGALASPKNSHFSAITDPPKVGRLLNMIENYQGTTTVINALRLAPYVFVRPGELRHAEWVEINFDKAQWLIPGNKMKMKRDHIVPLSNQAIVILQDQYLYSGNRDYVFPSLKSAKRAMSNNALNVALRTLGITKEEHCTHGWRATARTILAEVLEFSFEIIEHQLAHDVRDATGRSYNRTQFLPQRKEMMQSWADYLDKLKRQ